jgi:hypothetical protein
MGNHSVFIRDGDKGRRLHVLEFLLHRTACQQEIDKNAARVAHGPNRLLRDLPGMPANRSDQTSS